MDLRTWGVSGLLQPLDMISKLLLSPLCITRQTRPRLIWESELQLVEGLVDEGDVQIEAE
jgi:hypothetical protein